MCAGTYGTARRDGLRTSPASKVSCCFFFLFSVHATLFPSRRKDSNFNGRGVRAGGELRPSSKCWTGRERRDRESHPNGTRLATGKLTAAHRKSGLPDLISSWLFKSRSPN